MEGSEGFDFETVAQHGEAGRQFSVEPYVACGLSEEAEFGRGLVAQQAAALFGELRAYPCQLLRLFGLYHTYAFGEGVEAELGVGAVKGIGGLLVAAYLVRHIGGKTEFGIFVEAFEQRYAKRVGHGPVARIVAGHGRVEVGMLEEFSGLFGVVIQEEMLVAVIAQRVDKRRHRYIGAVGSCVVDLFLVPIANFIPIIYIELFARYSRVRVREVGRDRFGVYRCHAALQLGRVGDIEHVGDAAVFLVDRVVVVVVCLHFVAVAQVRTRETPR